MKIAVLTGGTSTERDVSIVTSTNVCKALRKKGHDANVIDVFFGSDEYADADLSLDTVCSKLGVSNSYFSSIFKKEVGISFITYLTDYRMQQAVHLMLETNEKNYEIAEHVGYEDANYFGYVFKRKYGMSPSKYRTEHMGK